MPFTPLSASQAKLYRRCIRRWAYVYLAGRREPDTEATKLGKVVHEELELWLRDGISPTHKLSTAMVSAGILPPPFTGNVEGKISFQLEHSAWRGYVDLRYMAEATAIVHDHKTTSDKDYALTVETLPDDLQANVYAYWSLLQCPDLPHALRWGYVKTKGASDVWAVDVPVDGMRVEKFICELDYTTGKEIQRLYNIRPKTSSLPCNTEACYDYGKQCPHYADCQPARTFSVERAKMSLPDFKSAMLAAFPGKLLVSQTPPPPAVFEAASLADAIRPDDRHGLVPVVDRGFINPPSNVVLAATPEEAAVLQNVVAPAAPVADDLDGMDRYALRALGVQIGAFDVNTKMREPGMRNAIRVLRATKGAVVEPACLPPDLEDAAAQQMACGDLDGDEAALERGIAAAMDKLEQQAAAAAMQPSTEATVAANNKAMCEWADHAEASNRPLFTVGGPFYVEPTGDKTSGIETLCINCRPNASVTTLADLLRQVQPFLEQAFGVNDYRFVDFGKGKGFVAEKLHGLLTEGTYTWLYVDTSTAEGMDFCGVLEQHAQQVIRSTR